MTTATTELITAIEATTVTLLDSIDRRLARFDELLTQYAVARWRARREQIAVERGQPR